MASAPGKQPALTARGCYVLALSLVLLIVGVGYGSGVTAAAGLGASGFLLFSYVSFLGRASLMWRRHVELLWWLPRAAGAEGLVAHRPFEVLVTLRNLSPLDLGIAELRVFGSRCVEVEGALLPLPLGPRTESTGRMQVRVVQAGQWFVHGAAVRLWDRLGLFALEAYFPSSLPLKVLPRQQPRVALPPYRVTGGAADQRVGSHSLRHHGLGGELRELREYVPGDPYKLIAWKASARAPLGQPLVRELERETVLVHYLLLDIGVTMREGRPGQWKLDHALELCASYARAVLDGSDRLGLITFDGAVHSHLRPGEGPTQRLRVTERLLDVMNVVDADFVAMTDGELCAAVARYLRQQEGVDVRVRRAPPMEDVRAWSQIAVAPTGELYHLPQLLSAAQRSLQQGARQNLGAPGASGATDKPSQPPPAAGELAVPPTDLGPLRRLCQQRGIELPYGQRSASGRAAGLSAALELAAGAGGARVVLLSDLLGIEADAPRIGRAAALCRRRGLRLTCIRPEARRYLPKEILQRPEAARAAEIFSWDQSRQEAHMHRALAQLGFHVIGVGPSDGLAQILGRTAQSHATGPVSVGSARQAQGQARPPST